MQKISNALIIDDKSNLILSEPEKKDEYEFKTLQNIKNYFLKNSIPFSIINNLGDAPLDAIAQIKNIPKPDLVVLDLDLNSDGEVDDSDINLLSIILNELNENFGDFILMIYSTEFDVWEDVKKNIVLQNKNLGFLLEEENTIVLKKEIEFDVALNEKISNQIFEKKSRYFFIKEFKIHSMIKKLWNKEIVLFAFFFIVFLALLYFSINGSSTSLLVSSIAIIVLVTIRFIIPEKNLK